MKRISCLFFYEHDVFSSMQRPSSVVVIQCLVSQVYIKIRVQSTRWCSDILNDDCLILGSSKKVKCCIVYCLGMNGLVMVGCCLILGKRSNLVGLNNRIICIWG